jgi:hypothetical protein
MTPERRARERRYFPGVPANSIFLFSPGRGHFLLQEEGVSLAKTKWRCPTGECQPKSKWVKGSRRNPVIPRNTKRWRSLYKGRASVEREFGRLKNEYGLAPLRVRGIERVALHADLVMLARLSQALARARHTAILAA